MKADRVTAEEIRNQLFVTEKEIKELSSMKTDDEIKQDRANSYGSPQASFGRISRLWSVYLGKNIQPKEVAVMMTLLKISRITTAKGDALVDSYQDSRIYLELAEELDLDEIYELDSIDLDYYKKDNE